MTSQPLLFRQVTEVQAFSLSFAWDEEDLDCLTIAGASLIATASPTLKRARCQRVEEDQENEDVNWGRALKRSRVRARGPQHGGDRDVLEPRPRVAPRADALGALRAVARPAVPVPPPDFEEVEEHFVMPPCGGNFVEPADRVLQGDDTPIAEPGGPVTPVVEPPPFSEDECVDDKGDSDISSVDSSSDSSESSSSSHRHGVARAPRSVPFGSIGWTIAPIMSNKTGESIQIGWGCVCGQHWNEADNRECKKQLIYGDKMDPDEARVRIKRWLLEGVTIDDQHHRARSKHLAIKPRDLDLHDEETCDRMAP